MDPQTLERVSKCIAKVLALSPDQIKADSRLVTDLGAESLDLVELMFELEQEFSIRLEQEDMSLSAQLGLPEQELHHNEVLTPRALELLRERFPAARDVLKDGIARRHLASLLTVDEVAKAVARKAAQAA